MFVVSNLALASCGASNCALMSLTGPAEDQLQASGASVCK